MNTTCVSLQRQILRDIHEIHGMLNKCSFANQLQCTMQLSIEFMGQKRAKAEKEYTGLLNFTKSIITWFRFILYFTEPIRRALDQHSVGLTEVLFSLVLSVLSSGRGSLLRSRICNWTNNWIRQFSAASRETEIALGKQGFPDSKNIFPKTKLCSS